jgi:chromosome segregation ATPase
VQLQKFNLVIEDLLRENTALKRQCDARATETQTVRFQIKEAENKNQRSNDENKALSLTIKGLKEERKRLEDECDELSSVLDEEISRLKAIEKEVRAAESANARLEKTLYQAEKDNSKLVGELGEKEEEIKRAGNRLKAVGNSIGELKLTYKNLEQQTGKSKGELERSNALLENEVGKGKELQGNISAVESTIRNQENELDLVIAEEERLRKDHFSALDKNKNLNNEIDRVLALIAEYEQVNRELLEEIEIFIEQDEQARSRLDRKEFMREVVESSVRKISLTEEPIRHLKC